MSKFEHLRKKKLEDQYKVYNNARLRRRGVKVEPELVILPSKDPRRLRIK